MSKKIKLESIPIGEDFEAWGRTFTVLDRIRSGVFVLQKTIEKEMSFNKDNGENPMNNFARSAVNKFLNGPYLEELDKVGPSILNYLPNLKIDLKCTLGQHEYGVCDVAAGLLTLEQYGQYYDIIPLADGPWWLATPWKTPSRSPSTYNTTGVWCVYSNGNCGNHSCSASYGVRPALLLNPSLLVSYEDNLEEEIDLSNIPTECLAQELCRRIQRGNVEVASA
jgi:hypothetical protein